MPMTIYSQNSHNSIYKIDHELRNLIGKDENVDVVIGIAGLGGGTGTGALPVLFRELSYARPNALKLAIVTLPFREEGIERIENARYGLREILDVADAVIVNANDILARKVKVTSIPEAFKIMNRRIVRIVESLVKLNYPEVGPGLINVDFSNIKKIFTKSGLCFAGVGTEFSIHKAFQLALRDDMAGCDITNARGALILFESTIPTSSLIECVALNVGGATDSVGFEV